MALMRFPWVRTPPASVEEEVETVVSVSIVKPLADGSTASVTATSRIKGRRQIKRLSFAPLAVRGKLGVRGDVRIREALRVTQEFAPSLRFAVAGKVALRTLSIDDNDRRR